MIEISSQMREFVNFAQDAVAGNGKNSIARLDKQESRYSAFSISAATDGDSVGKLRRSAASKNANNIVRTKFRDAVAQMFGGADKIPESVRAAMNMQDYEKGKPLTADRILDVYAAIKEHISGLKNAALNDGTLRAIDVADTAADQFVEKFKARCTPPPSAVAASNLKRTLLLCAANILDDGKAQGGKEAIKKFAKELHTSFKYTFKALGFDTATHKVDNQRIENLMKDELHMRRAVFALLDENGNVDVNRFDARLAVFGDARLKYSAPAILRANLETPGPAAVKALRQEFMRMAIQDVENAARSEVDAFFKANPDKIPAALRNDRREAERYVQLVRAYVNQKGEKEAGARLAAGDATAKIDVAAALKDFNGFMDSIYAAAKGDKDLLGLIERFAGAITFNGAGERRSLEDIKKKFIEPVRENLRELRAVAGGNAAILKAGVDALVQSEMTPFKKGVFTKLANGAKNLSLNGLDSVSARSTPIEIAKAFTGLYAQFKKAMPTTDYNDPLSRAERNAYTLFFSGVVMSRLDADAKVRMVMTFSSKAAGDASNIMQTLVTGSPDLTPAEVSDLQETTQMMRKCSTFIADDLSLDADVFALNEIDEKITAESIPDDVKAQFAGLMKGLQE